MGVKFIAAGDDTMEKIRVYRATSGITRLLRTGAS